MLYAFPSLIGLRKTVRSNQADLRGGRVSIPHRIEKNSSASIRLDVLGLFPSLIGLRKTERGKRTPKYQNLFPSLIGLRKTVFTAPGLYFTTQFPSLIGLRKTRGPFAPVVVVGVVSIPHRIEKNRSGRIKRIFAEVVFPSLIGLRKTTHGRARRAN